MFLFAMAFLMGDVYLQTFSHLPSLYFIYFFMLINFLVWFFLRHRYSYIFIWMACAAGFCWTAWCAHQRLAWTLPKAWEGRPVWVRGRVSSLPQARGWQTQFDFSLEKIQFETLNLTIHHTVHLSWQSCPYVLHPGEEWYLPVRLKRIHGTQNTGSVDFEAWALQKGLRAAGMVRSNAQAILLKQNQQHFFIQAFRQRLQEKIQQHLPAAPHAAWLITLILGEHHNIPREDWEILRRTGTNHLMAIGGLHIGILAGLMYRVAIYLWKCSARLPLFLPAQQAGACMALATAAIYAAIAGFSIPSERAFIMLSVGLLALLLKRKMNPYHAWSTALLIVLIINPFDVLSESFWLSFATLAFLLYSMSGRLSVLSSQHGWRLHSKMQWAITLGLFPLSLFLFQECSVVALIVNMIAIPWLTFFILPFCFLSSIFLFILPPLGHVCLYIAGKSAAALWKMLELFSHLPFAVWHHAIFTQSIFFLACIGVLILLLPAKWPGKYVGLVWLLPLYFYQPSPPQQGECRLTLLDVGQGLSVVVETKKHTLVYDTGLKWNDNDMGERVVLPYLYAVNTKRLDMLVISHGDNDHIGGALALIQGLPIDIVKSSVPQQIPIRSASYCLAGEKWQWDGVNFEFLFPSLQDLHRGNDSSCVLKIDNGVSHVLLTGDIEKQAEKKLVTEEAARLPAEILVAPHHGSKTSGLTAFISSVHPQFVLYATGYKNRYHFPHQSILAAYEKIHAMQFSTDKTGMIQFMLKHPQQKEPSLGLQPILYRKDHAHYWFDDAP